MFNWKSNNWDYTAVGLNSGTNTVLYGGEFEYLPSQRQDFATAVLNDQIYVIGGYGISGYNYMLGIPISPIATMSGLVEHYTPFGYGRIAPEVSIVSLETEHEYSFGGIPLEFSLNRPVAWIGYCIDGQATVTITGNTTLSGLSSGQHSVRVFAEDEYGNMGASDTVVFSVASEPFPWLLVVAVVGVVAVICGGLLFLFLKKPRSSKS